MEIRYDDENEWIMFQVPRFEYDESQMPEITQGLISEFGCHDIWFRIDSPNEPWQKVFHHYGDYLGHGPVQ